MKLERFDAFLKANEKRIYHYLLTLLGNDSDAKDIAQMVFLSFYEHIDRVEDATALSYLYKIAHNKAMTFLKQKGRYVCLPSQAFEHIPDAGAPQTERDWSFLHSSIRELPPRLSSVIMMQYFEGLSYKQISEQLGISVKAVESLLVRAKKILRKKMLKEETRIGV